MSDSSATPVATGKRKRAKPLTVTQAKAEILRRIGKSKARSVSSKVRLGDTAQQDIDQAFRELRDEGRLFARGGALVRARADASVGS